MNRAGPKALGPLRAAAPPGSRLCPDHRRVRAARRWPAARGPEGARWRGRSRPLRWVVAAAEWRRRRRRGRRRRMDEWWREQKGAETTWLAGGCVGPIPPGSGGRGRDKAHRMTGSGGAVARGRDGGGRTQEPKIEILDGRLEGGGVRGQEMCGCPKAFCRIQRLSPTPGRRRCWFD